MELIHLLIKLVVWLTRRGERNALAEGDPRILRTASDVRRSEARRPSPRAAAVALAAAVDSLKARAAALQIALEEQRSARRFLPALTSWMTGELAMLRHRVETGTADSDAVALRRGGVELVLAEIAQMAADRRDPELAGALGDADALASACYQPIIDHARAEGLPLTVAEPAARLGDFELAIGTGFAPTGVAPIFLPDDFFTRVAWWPALAHEIGHSFLASVRGLDAGLRAELGLPTERAGLELLEIEALPLAELERVVGGWFEELFCDVFGTLMCGPAYVRTMVTLFATEHHPHAAIVADEGTPGRYHPHPPRQLRVIAGCRVLSRAGLHAEAQRLRAEWDQRHRIEGAAPGEIILETTTAYAAVPLAVFEELIHGLVDRLYTGPLEALGGFGLPDIAGLGSLRQIDGASQRVRDQLLAGKVPTVRDVRAVIAGAVLAAHARPEREASILAAARAAIPALGTGEARPDAYATRTGTTGAGAVTARELRDALVLRAVLDAPPGLRRGRGHPRVRR